jgi:hypothetical protein
VDGLLLAPAIPRVATATCDVERIDGKARLKVERVGFTATRVFRRVSAQGNRRPGFVLVLRCQRWKQRNGGRQRREKELAGRRFRAAAS